MLQHFQLIHILILCQTETLDCREVAAEAGLRTTYVACGEKDTPSRIMSLLVAGLKVHICKIS